MLRRSLQLTRARLLGSTAWTGPLSATRTSLGHSYATRAANAKIMSNSLCRLYSDNETSRDPRSPKDPTQTLTQVNSISDIIRQDHREIERYYEKIVSSDDHDVQRRYQNAFVWELTRHAIAEELVVYPSIETGVNNGKVMADKDRAEHQLTKNQLYKFQNTNPGDKDFIPTLESLWKDLKVHIQEEEEHDLVKLEEALLPTRSKDLAQQFEMTKAFTPTRSHPSAPNKPPYETAVGLMTAPLDKLRDMFRSWPDEPGPKPRAGGPGR